MRNTIWNAARKLTLGMAVVAGFLTVGAVSAKAAPIQFEVGFGARPACPGDGYVWVDGYDNGGYWVPGAWVFRGYGGGYGYRAGYGYGGGFRYDHDRRFDGYRNRGWDRNRGWGNDRHFDNDHRFEHGYGNNNNRGFDRGEHHGNERGFGGDHHGRR